MKAIRLSVAAVISSAALAAAAFGQAPASTLPASMQRLIVMLKPGVGALPDVASLGGRVEFSLPDRMIVTVPAGAIAEIEQNPRVQYVQRSGGAAEQGALSGPRELVPVAQQVRRTAPQSGNGEWKTGAYAYDGEGNISAIGTSTERNSDGQANAYAYDKVGRLVTADAHYAVGNYNENYTYDPFGNMTSRTTTKPGGTQDVAEYAISPATNRRNNGSDGLERYDSAGNEVHDPDTSSTRRFDSLNMMTYKQTSATEEYYIYTPADQRIGILTHTTAAPTVWPWTWSVRDEGGSLLRQYSSSELAPAADWLWVEDYLYAGDRLLAAERMSSQGGRRHFHLDHLGTPRLITGPTGTLIARHDYLPFGAEVTPSDAERIAGFDRVEPKQFTGHERDSGSDALDYMHARYYANATGRFLSVDSHSGRPEKPNSWNRYIYADDSPVNALDPTGRWTLFVKEINATVALGKGAGVGAGTFMAISSNTDISSGVTTKFGGGQAADVGFSIGICRADSAEEFSKPAAVLEAGHDITEGLSVGVGTSFVEGSAKPDSLQLSFSFSGTMTSLFGGVETAHVLSSSNVKENVLELQKAMEKSIAKAATNINAFVDAAKTAASPGTASSFDILSWVKRVRFAPTDVDAKKPENK